MMEYKGNFPLDRYEPTKFHLKSENDQFLSICDTYSDKEILQTVMKVSMWLIITRLPCNLKDYDGFLG